MPGSSTTTFCGAVRQPSPSPSGLRRPATASSCGPRRCSVENYYSTSGFAAVCLKRPSEPLDESSLINAVSGWGFRTVWFQASCLGELRINPTLGKARTPTNTELDHITPDANRVLIADAWTYSDAVAKVRQAIATITTTN